MQGHAFAGKFQTEPQPFIYGFRGRMDERYRLRAQRRPTAASSMLRNYMPHLSQAQSRQPKAAYQFETPSHPRLAQAQPSMKANSRPSNPSSGRNLLKVANEELYDACGGGRLPQPTPP
jgi:hypothetical protein